MVSCDVARRMKMHHPSSNGFSFHDVCTHMFILSRTRHSLRITRVFFLLPVLPRYYDTFNGPNVIVLNDWALTLAATVRRSCAQEKNECYLPDARPLYGEELRKQQCCRSGLLLRHLAPRRVSSSAKRKNRIHQNFGTTREKKRANIIKLGADPSALNVSGSLNVSPYYAAPKFLLFSGLRAY